MPAALLQKIFLYSILLFCITSTCISHPLDWLFDQYGTQKLSPTHEEYIKDIIHELGITKSIQIRKMNRNAMLKFGVRNAFAYWNNYIFVSEFFLDELSKEESRWLIGHELMHIEKNHLIKWAMLNGSLLIGGLIMAKMIYSYGVLQKYKLSPLAPSLVSFISFYFLSFLIFKKYSRYCEYEADAGSALYLHEFYGAHAFCKHMEEKENIHGYNDDSFFYQIVASHPSWQQRDAALKKIKTITT